MLKVGITGGLGSGKSIASKVVKKMGCYVFDADAEGKILLVSNLNVQNELIAEFGSDILNGDDTINRQKLARTAFQDEDHQMRLNTVIHPYIFDEIDKQYEKLLDEGQHEVFVVDGALIFESGLDSHLDYTVVITAPFAMRMSRALSRGGLNRDQIQKRMGLQWKDEDKISLANYVINNTKDEDYLTQQIKEIFGQFI
ncbi:MAG: dephospho-CoA kinase [Candidatus Marinimicrobia bacterium]|nr:dephospho-CoA kinase [Candidatus Neomarinimicrobiota bacterium]